MHFFLVSVSLLCLYRLDCTIASLSQVGLKSIKLTAHLTPFVEGCSLASTIIGTALRELTVLCARIASRWERLVLLLLTVVVSKRSKNACTQDSNMSLTLRVPLPCVMWPIVTHELTGLSKCANATMLTLICGVVWLRKVMEYHRTYLQAMGCSWNGG